MAAEEEEEVRMEVEAVRAFYGDDCEIIREFPPHLHVHITPRTADDSSQQFVEVVLGIMCDAQYPQKPPHLHIVDSKGLDETREKHLITSIENKSEELSACLMIITLCEDFPASLQAPAYIYPGRMNSSLNTLGDEVFKCGTGFRLKEIDEDKENTKENMEISQPEGRSMKIKPGFCG